MNLKKPAAVVPPTAMPDKLAPPGLEYNIRQFCDEDKQDIVCPNPGVPQMAAVDKDQEQGP